METSKSKLKLNVLRKVVINVEDRKQTDNSGYAHLLLKQVRACTAYCLFKHQLNPKPSEIRCAGEKAKL
jgi:hypothetical protein